MRGPHNIWRLTRTLATLERTGAIGAVLEAFSAPPRIRFAARLLGLPFAWLGLRGDPALPPAPRALTALGPAYIKFGQLLSTRPDIVGEALADQLRYLQDKLPPFPTAQAKAVIEAELGQPTETLFTTFSDPVAAASIAQVHRAHLAEDGREVAVKVLRPGIARAFQKDIDAFYFAARAIEILAPFTRRLRPREVIAHFESVVHGELDLRLECAAAAEFAANTEKDPALLVPRPIWPLSSRQVMTMSWAEGLSLSDTEALDRAGVDRPLLAEQILQVFLRHALRDGFFHADMHPGNLRVAPPGPDQKAGALVLFDFGIMGRLDDYTRRVYAEILYGFMRRDYRRVAEVHFEAGYVPPGRDIDEFARALRVVGEPIFGMDASHISMARLLAYLFEVTEKFGMQTRTELILLQRTMVVVEGVARALDPHINIWRSARPVVEDYIRRNIGPPALARDLLRSARVLARFGPKLPALMEAQLQRLSQRPEAPAPHHARAALTLALGLTLGAAATWAALTLF